MKSRLKVVGLGELLWDMLPSGKQLGGAPANFAYMTSLLGHQAIVASRVGHDPPGEEAVARLKRLGLAIEYLQFDREHPTGTVAVRLDAQGLPSFTISEAVAWDFLDWTPAWAELASEADVVCFGTLAQRHARSRQTIRQFLQAAPASALKIFDVNLRQSFFGAEVLAESLPLSQIVKLNHEELPVVCRLLGLACKDEESGARQLLRRYHLKLVCITRGAGGSLIVDPDVTSSHPGFCVKAVDTVGSGDAFTACLAHHYLRGASLEEINAAANRLAAWVASQLGGTPALNGRTLEDVLPSVE
ncbi:MAG TPA: carbohydrate kinase [Terriglobales bacterium]